MLEMVEFVLIPIGYSAAVLIPEDRAPAWLWPALVGLLFLVIGAAVSFVRRRPGAELVAAPFFLVLALIIVIDRRFVWLMIVLVPAVVLAALAYLAIKGRA